MQEKDNESEAEQKPPDSSGLIVIRIKSLHIDMSKGEGEAFWHKRGGRDRGRDKYANANPGIANESLERSSQSCLFLFSQLLRLI
ncbi:MAG: hypothetical protein U9O85_03110 [Euryarchaeota archaeon]|nr:hypothetical protein [Euryarchaeota archaeon]